MPRAKTPRNGDANNKKVTPITQGVSFETRKTTRPMDLSEEIRRRAYELYEQRGGAPGHEHEDWISAEREVQARHSQQTA